MNNKKTTTTFEILDGEIASDIESVIKKYGGDPLRLIDILLEVQENIPRKFIPKEIAAFVADELSLPLIQVYDVITFYSALSMTPRAENIVQICESVVCQVENNAFLKKAIEEALGIAVGESTKDGKFFLNYTPCFGACDIAPAMRINGEVYGHLTSKEKINEALAKY